MLSTYRRPHTDGLAGVGHWPPAVAFPDISRCLFVHVLNGKYPDCLLNYRIAVVVTSGFSVLAGAYMVIMQVTREVVTRAPAVLARTLSHRPPPPSPPPPSSDDSLAVSTCCTCYSYLFAATLLLGKCNALNDQTPAIPFPVLAVSRPSFSFSFPLDLSWSAKIIPSLACQASKSEHGNRREAGSSV